MEASINNAKVALRQEISRLNGVLGHLMATLSHLDSLSPADKAHAVTSTVSGAPAASNAPGSPTTSDATAKAAPLAQAAPPTPIVAAKPTAASQLYSSQPSPASPEAARQLHLDVDAWMPKLTRVPLADVYLAATLDRPKHLPQLPSSLDMENTEVLRILGNYLRHTEVVGYRDFCARLKVYTGLSHLYKRVRDKATAAINTAYPELAGGTYEFPVNNQKPAPSGATQFAALATLLPSAHPAPAAAA